MIDVIPCSDPLSPSSSISAHTTGLLDLPPEVLALVIWKLSPVTLTRFSQACRALHNYVESLGELLWRDMLLDIWDDPRLADEVIMAIRAPDFCVSPDIAKDDEPLSSLSYISPIESKRQGKRPATASHNLNVEFRWRDEVRRRTEAEIFLARFGQSFNADGSARRDKTMRTLLSTLATTPPASPTLIRSRNMVWVERLLAPGKFNSEFLMRHFFHDADVKQPLTPDRQLTAKLQVHFFSHKHQLSPEKLQISRLNARAYVYNIRNYRGEGWHGPWVLENGLMQPNWIHLAACQRVILANLAQRRVIGHTYPVPPMGAEAAWGQGAKAMAVARKANPSRINEAGFNDWAGVEGVWRRLVCFMDYRDFHEYNVHGQRTSGGLDTSIFRQKNFNEATRIITMTLKITGSEPSEPPFEHRPRLKFEGISVANDTMISVVHGFVCMTPSGHVRWHLVTRYDTDDRWVTEAVQIGDAGSAAGFLGTWTGNNHEPDDPAGPTWLWKIADVSEIPKEDRLRGLGHEGWIFPDVFFNGYGHGFPDESDDDDDEDDEYGDGDEEMEGSGSGGDSQDEDEDEDVDDESSSSDGTGYALPSTLPSLQPLDSLFD